VNSKELYVAPRPLRRNVGYRHQPGRAIAWFSPLPLNAVPFCLRLGAVSGLVGIGNKQSRAGTLWRRLQPLQSTQCRSMSVEGIVRRDREDPRPGPREILMQARASSLNYRDLMVLKGNGRRPNTKLKPYRGATATGQVSAVRGRVTRVKVGDRIAGE
jgi:Alcohol dehydrogenase GroES-like domain